MTREQRRARWRANWLGVAAVAGLLAVGVLVGRVCAGEPERPPVVPAAAVRVEPVAAENLFPPVQPTPEPVPTPAPEVCYPLTQVERDMVERVVMAEAGAEDFDGQALVAQCILNTARARDMRPDAVVREKNQYARPAAQASPSVREAVSAVFDGGYAVTREPVRWFYAPRYCAGRWHERSLVFVLEHGATGFLKRRRAEPRLEKGRDAL